MSTELLVSSNSLKQEEIKIKYTVYRLSYIIEQYLKIKISYIFSTHFKFYLATVYCRLVIASWLKTATQTFKIYLDIVYFKGFEFQKKLVTTCIPILTYMYIMGQQLFLLVTHTV